MRRDHRRYVGDHQSIRNPSLSRDELGTAADPTGEGGNLFLKDAAEAVGGASAGRFDGFFVRGEESGEGVGEEDDATAGGAGAEMFGAEDAGVDEA